MKSKLPYSKRGRRLGQVLLRLRLLAARIGSQPLAEWVRHESEGYPHDAELPDYRFIPVSYTANFSWAVWGRNQERAYLTVLGEEVRRGALGTP